MATSVPTSIDALASTLDAIGGTAETWCTPRRGSDARADARADALTGTGVGAVPMRGALLKKVTGMPRGKIATTLPSLVTAHHAHPCRTQQARNRVGRGVARALLQGTDAARDAVDQRDRLFIRGRKAGRRRRGGIAGTPGARTVDRVTRTRAGARESDGDKRQTDQQRAKR
jgi:hypothetical protein